MIEPVPGPRGLRSVALVPKLARDPFGACMNLALANDGLARIKAGPACLHLVYHPDYVNQVLVADNRSYGKGAIMSGIRLALGEGLFTAEHDRWKVQRRLMQPAFHRQKIARIGRVTERRVAEAIDSWQPSAAADEPVDLLDEMIVLNIRVILEAMFGDDLTDAAAADLRQATDGVFIGMAKRVWTFFLPGWVPAPGRRSFAQSIRRLEDKVDAIVAQRRRDPQPRDDLLGLLLDARDPDTGQAMTDREIRDEVFTLFMAGYESSASAASWTLELLSQHPDVQEKVAAELQAVVGDKPPTAEDLARAPYLGRVIDEVLRLYPSFPMFFRTAEVDTTIGRFAIPSGSPIVLSPYATHHHPDYWDDPERFDPDRFLPERFGDDQHRAYYPFGVGPRVCIGRSLALMQASLVVASVLCRYRLQPVRTEPAGQDYAMILQPRGGLWTHLTPRRPAPDVPSTGSARL